MKHTDTSGRSSRSIAFMISHLLSILRFLSQPGFVPSMLNLASLLISGRGSGHILNPSTIDPMPSSAPSSETQLSPRLEELRQAETLYMRVIGMSGMGSATPASGAAKSPNQEMAEFAQEALEGVRDMIKEEMKKY